MTTFFRCPLVVGSQGALYYYTELLIGSRCGGMRELDRFRCVVVFSSKKTANFASRYGGVIINDNILTVDTSVVYFENFFISVFCSP